MQRGQSTGGQAFPIRIHARAYHFIIVPEVVAEKRSVRPKCRNAVQTRSVCRPVCQECWFNRAALAYLNLDSLPTVADDALMMHDCFESSNDCSILLTVVVPYRSEAMADT